MSTDRVIAVRLAGPWASLRDMQQLLVDEPVLTLFLVAALGALLGRIRVAGVSFGVAAVVFAGLAVSAVVPGAALPELVVVLGLAVFVYMVGLASGPSLRHVLRGGGGGVVAGAAAVLVVTATAVWLTALLLDVGDAGAAGAFAGALTNTPTLATVVDALGAGEGELAVVAFSITYPLGMAVTLLATVWALRGGSTETDQEGLVRVTVTVTDPALVDVAQLLGPQREEVTVVRVQGGADATPEPDTVAVADTPLATGATVTLLGAPAAVEEVARRAGGQRRADAFRDRSALDFRQVWVTDRAVVGRTVGELQLPVRRGATITRVARGDVEWLARDDSELQMGDRVTLVAPTATLETVAEELGDELRRTSEFDVLTVGLGVVLGLALGAVSVPLGPVTVRLGFAGGPLVAGLVLGSLVRTGPLVWQVPQSASVTLRQFGLVLFLAGVGTRAGPAFVEALSSPVLPRLLLVGLVAIVVPLAVAFAARRHAVALLRTGRAGTSTFAGLVAGLTSQPAALALAQERGADQDALVGYAAVFPVAMIGKILLGQAIAALL